MTLIPKLYFLYIAKLYTKNFLVILLGMSLMFVLIDYLGHANKVSGSTNQLIMYVYYIWQSSLTMLYPLALVFAVIVTKMNLVKNNTMGALHSFGYSKRTLFAPIFTVGAIVYIVFVWLQTSSFVYAKDEAQMLIGNGSARASKNLFFKYNDTFVYIDKLDPVAKKIIGVSLFKTDRDHIEYTMKAPYALYNGKSWDVHNVVMYRNHYTNGYLDRYSIEQYKTMTTLDGYKPAIMESINEGSSLTLIDAFGTWELFESQGLNSDKIRAGIYDKVVFPLFAFSLMVLLFFKIPFLSRFGSIAKITTISLGGSLLAWGTLMGLSYLGANGVVMPEISSFVPIMLLSGYAIMEYFARESTV
ncbi:MAG: LptF/LptG family permease [Sulfurovaceae bacterium]|nr:LptF/LptG family permease [Sulfurovaceae bacterium]